MPPTKNPVKILLPLLLPLLIIFTTAAIICTAASSHPPPPAVPSASAVREANEDELLLAKTIQTYVPERYGESLRREALMNLHGTL
jgi:hypothetical protein